MFYLDNAATTKIDKEVAKVISDSLFSEFANPSSLYDIGAFSEKAINKARKTISKAINSKEGEIYFTSCASESNAILIYGLALARKNRGKKIITTSYEHPSVTSPFEMLREYGYEVVFIAPDEKGQIDIEKIIDSVDSSTVLVSCIHVNNETGAIVDIDELSKKVKEKNKLTAVHIDAVQSFMKLKLDVNKLNIDALTFSGHKINAPKGIGGFYLKQNTNIEKVLSGGGQEKGVRGGTENIHYIKGLEKAVEFHTENNIKHLRKYKELKEYLLLKLEDFDNIEINSPINAVDYILNISFKGFLSENVLHFLESEEVYVSQGSACSKGSQSKTLSAMNLSEDKINSSIRISFGYMNEKEDINALITALKNAKDKLQRIRK